MRPFLKLVDHELLAARQKHPQIHDLHAAYSVILEEVDEFWGEVKKQVPDRSNVLQELVQIAAMCCRAAEDLRLKGVT
ncbi:MAG: hypothetical protein ACREA0_10240 [bacterium]